MDVRPLMRRRPLLRGAAIGGGAYDAGKRRIETAEKLQQLPRSRDAGVVTEAEFERRRAALVTARHAEP